MDGSEASWPPSVREGQTTLRKGVDMKAMPIRMAYTCRGCGIEIPYPGRFKKCPVCGVKGGW